MGWLGWESDTYLNPIDFNINMCKWDTLITSVFRLTLFPPSTNCYGEILRRHLACFIIHLISETLVCINVDQVKLSCTVVVPWHLCIEKSNEHLLKQLVKETSFSQLSVYVAYRYRHTWDIWTVCWIYCTYRCLFDELLWGDFEICLEICLK